MEIVSQMIGFPKLSITVLVLACGAAATFFIAVRTIYRLFFHPLSTYPGPKLWAASRLPWNFYNLQGRLAWKIFELHELYGPTIRVAPDELSYTSSRAWKKIYGQSHPEFPKCLDGRGIAPVTRQVHLRGIVTADQPKHGRLKRAIAPAFSDRALRAQECYLQTHTDKLIGHLKAQSPKEIDLVKWLNLTTFDMISELAFGQAEGCLDNAEQSWLDVMGTRSKSVPLHQLARYYGLDGIISWFTPQSWTRARQQHILLTSAKVKKRMEMSNPPQDFMSYILDNKTEKMTNVELVVMASTFLVAGSGTTARAMSATIYFLCTNRDKLEIAVHEVRGAFKNEAEITMQSTLQLTYLTACLNESMRCHPPQPSSLPRFVPGNGEEIEGRWVPGGTAVGVHQISSGYAKGNFVRSGEFLPERWLSPSGEFANDDKAAIQPFSYGSRACTGMGLSWVEMRLIMAKLLWNFDLELCAASQGWTKQLRSFTAWEQKPMMVKLHPRGSRVRT